MSRPEPATAGERSPETEVGSVFVSNYPPYSVWSPDHLAPAQEALAQPPRPETDFGIYLHIPFCRKRCKFCYFRVYTDKNFDEIGSYLDALATEVDLYAELPAIRGRRPSFVYFGGGTPSFISSEQLETLVARLKQAIPWSGAQEVTFECEPGTLSRSKLDTVKEIGVTRLSLGIEHYDDEVLRINGRAHVSKEIYRCLPWIQEVGFEQLNVDLIAGLVGDSWSTWKKTVASTVELAPDSVTIYQMELPFNTRFSHQLQTGKLEHSLVDWETKRRWNDYAFDELSKAGYEVSSAYTMVRSDRKSPFVYRDAVWHGCDLLGTGVASFSHVNGFHFQNADGWGAYMAELADGRLPLTRAHATSADERLTRELILQLKLGRLEGSYFKQKFGVDILDEFAPVFGRLEEGGFLERENSGVKLTRSGLLRVDTLLPEFYASEYRNARYT